MILMIVYFRSTFPFYFAFTLFCLLKIPENAYGELEHGRIFSFDARRISNASAETDVEVTHISSKHSCTGHSTGEYGTGTSFFSYSLCFDDNAVSTVGYSTIGGSI
jgi:hypothetical protein